MDAHRACCWLRLSLTSVALTASATYIDTPPILIIPVRIEKSELLEAQAKPVCAVLAVKGARSMTRHDELRSPWSAAVADRERRRVECVALIHTVGDGAVPSCQLKASVAPFLGGTQANIEEPKGQHIVGAGIVDSNGQAHSPRLSGAHKGCSVDRESRVWQGNVISMRAGAPSSAQRQGRAQD
eukprot:4858807-Prymnesium_polylepis.1